MVIKSIVAYLFTNVYNVIRYCVDTIVYLITLATNFSLVMLNAALSTLVLIEELAVFCLVLPWIPAKKIGDIYGFVRRYGFPRRITFTLYAMMLVTFVVFNLISLELHYLQSNESLRTNFDEFKNSLFSLMKLSIILHRLLNLLSNEAWLRSTCYMLKKRLKIEQGEELNDKDLEESTDEELEISNLKGELERTKLDLEAMKEAYMKLQLKLQRM